MFLSIVLLFFGAVLFCRSLSFAYMYAALYADRASRCLPRLARPQKAADLINVMYYLCITLIGLWILVCGGWLIFSEGMTPILISLIIPYALLLILVIYLILFRIIDRKGEMMETFDKVVSYRAKQKVYSENNDHEVNLIRGVKRAIQDRKYVIVWIGGLVIYIIIQATR